MKNQETKKLVKELTEKIKKTRDEKIVFTKNTIVKGHNFDEKYVTKNDFKELVALYNVIKNDDVLDTKKYEDLINDNAKKFPFLFKCNESIYDFISELRWHGVYFIAKEMCRQGKEIDYINEVLDGRKSKNQ